MEAIDLTDPDTYTHGVPHQEFHRLRTEAPVTRREEHHGKGYWAVTRHHDVVTVLRNPTLYSSWRGGALLADPSTESLAKLRDGMMHRDPPDHAWLRSLVNEVLNPRQTADLECWVAEHARMLVDRVRGTGTCDFVTELAEKMPLFVICEILGVPEADREVLAALTGRMLGSDLTDPMDAMRDSFAAADELRQYGAELGKARRARPTNDLVSNLLAAQIDGRRLSEGEFQAFFMLLFNAGSDTTRSLLCHGLDLLLDRPELIEYLRANPGRLPGTVEEMLRYVSPVLHLRRTANRETELCGVRIAEGDKVVTFLPSANRDEAVFTDPDRFDVARTPNPHVAFGLGPHYCGGAALARLESRYLLGELLGQTTQIERVAPIVTARSNFVRRVRHLEIALA